MEKNWHLETCGGVKLYTAMIWATGLVSDPFVAWNPSLIYWNDTIYDRGRFWISEAFVVGYLQQNWEHNEQE